MRHRTLADGDAVARDRDRGLAEEMAGAAEAIAHHRARLAKDDDDHPAWTKKNILGLTDDDRKESDMLTDDDFTDALLDLDNKITNARQLHKGLQALEADLDDMRGEVTERAASCVFR